jgi:hypothetical protein
MNTLAKREVFMIGEKIFLLLGVMCLFFVFFGKKRGKIFEWLSFLWLRIAASVLVLYGLHIAATYFSVQIVVNIFTIACVVLLGLPGLGVVLFISALDFLKVL